MTKKSRNSNLGFPDCTVKGLEHPITPAVTIKLYVKVVKHTPSFSHFIAIYWFRITFPGSLGIDFFKIKVCI